MLEAHIFRTYQKDLRNLALQERRLRNQLKQDTAELRRLQAERRERETATEPGASASATKPQNGFEFSTPQNQPAHEPVPTPEPAQPSHTNLKSETIAA